MSAKQLPRDSLSGPPGAPYHVSLSPLLFDGQAALAPDPAAGVVHISLAELITACHNAFNEVTIRKADDLFACAAKAGQYYDPIPKGAELLEATFQVQLVDSPVPHAVNLAPPHTLIFQNPEDAARLLPLLSRRGFTN